VKFSPNIPNPEPSRRATSATLRTPGRRHHNLSVVCSWPVGSRVTPNMSSSFRQLKRRTFDPWIRTAAATYFHERARSRPRHKEKMIMPIRTPDLSHCRPYRYCMGNSFGSCSGPAHSRNPQESRR
jgi:hypothetical protein